MNYASMMQQFGQQFGRQRSNDFKTSSVAAASRRSFIKLAGMGGLAIGIAPLTVMAEGESASNAAEAAAGLGAGQQPNAFLHIAPDGTVTVQINRLEFGQGSHTGLGLILK